MLFEDYNLVYVVVVLQSLSCVQLFMTSWTATRQASQSFTVSRSLLKLVSIESMMPSNYLIHCCLFLLLPSFFHSIRVFSNETSHQLSSVQFSRSVVSDSLRPHGLQHARLPCPSPTPGTYSNSCPSNH